MPSWSTRRCPQLGGEGAPAHQDVAVKKKHFFVYVLSVSYRVRIRGIRDDGETRQAGTRCRRTKSCTTSNPKSRGQADRGEPGSHSRRLVARCEKRRRVGRAFGKSAHSAATTSSRDGAAVGWRVGFQRRPNLDNEKMFVSTLSLILGFGSWECLVCCCCSDHRNVLFVFFSAGFRI